MATRMAPRMALQMVKSRRVSFRVVSRGRPLAGDPPCGRLLKSDVELWRRKSGLIQDAAKKRLQRRRRRRTDSEGEEEEVSFSIIF